MLYSLTFSRQLLLLLPLFSLFSSCNMFRIKEEILCWEIFSRLCTKTSKWVWKDGKSIHSTRIDPRIWKLSRCSYHRKTRALPVKPLPRLMNFSRSHSKMLMQHVSYHTFSLMTSVNGQLVTAGGCWVSSLVSMDTMGDIEKAYRYCKEDYIYVVTYKGTLQSSKRGYLMYNSANLVLGKGSLGTRLQLCCFRLPDFYTVSELLCMRSVNYFAYCQ